MNVIKQTGLANTTYYPGRKILYIAVHYTAGVSSKIGSARGCASWFSRADADGSADYIVDDDELVQYNPDPLNRYCHAVGGARYNTKGGRLFGVAKNSNCVSLEICSTNANGKITVPNDPAYSFSNAVIDHAREAVKYLMKLYGIDAAHVIRHYDVNGKPCPGVIGWNKDSGDESKWESFHASIGGRPIQYKVRKTWNDSASQVGAYSEWENAKEAADKHPGYSVYDKGGKKLYTSETPVPGKYPSGLPASKESYIEACGAIARELMKETGILASVVTAQCCLETGFGLGTDSVPLMKVNNLLGMKSELINSTWKDHTVWGGESIEKRTPEYVNGRLVYKEDSFRKYRDYENCIRDYEMFLLNVKNNKGYKYRRIQGMTDPGEVIHAIRIGTGTNAKPEGYCTDPAYEGKILSLIRQYGLEKYNISEPPAPAPEQEKEDDKKQPAGKMMRVQIGAFDHMENSFAGINTCKKRTGLDAFAEKRRDGIWRLYCGSFETEEKAYERLTFMQGHGYPQAFIVVKE